MALEGISEDVMLLSFSFWPTIIHGFQQMQAEYILRTCDTKSDSTKACKHLENNNIMGFIDYLFLQNWHKRIGKIIVYSTECIPWNMTFKENQLITARWR